MIKTVPVVMDRDLARAKYLEYSEHITTAEQAAENAVKAAADTQTTPARTALDQYTLSIPTLGMKNVSPQRGLQTFREGDVVRPLPPLSARVDIALRDAYLAISEGKQVIDLTATFKKAGEDHEHRPRIGIGRAAWRGVKMSRVRNGSFTITNISETGEDFRFPEGTLRFHREDGVFSATAVIPSIPPKLRPDNLDDFCVLWEPIWVGQAPPREKIDPLLLRPLGLGSPLYVVIAAWDLTPIEAAVLSMA